MTFIINQIIFVLYNLYNSYKDHQQIKKGIVPDHFNNGLIYCMAIGLFVAVFDMAIWWQNITFVVACFCNRQLFFDITLNLRRGLPWYYISTAADPGSWIDKIEIRIFGNNDGRKPVYIYLATWIITIIINLIF